MAVCLGWGGGGCLPRSCARLPVRVGWGEGEDAPASLGVSFFPTHPTAGAQQKTALVQWVGAVGNVLVCVFNSSGVSIRLGLVC